MGRGRGELWVLVRASDRCRVNALLLFRAGQSLHYLEVPARDRPSNSATATTATTAVISSTPYGGAFFGLQNTNYDQTKLLVTNGTRPSKQDPIQGFS